MTEQELLTKQMEIHVLTVALTKLPTDTTLPAPSKTVFQINRQYSGEDGEVIKGVLEHFFKNERSKK